MALTATHNKNKFSVGDMVTVVQKIRENDKERTQSFEGMVIKIKGRDMSKSFTVRKIGAQQIGIEKIFPLFSPTIIEIKVIRKGLRGVRRAKLYYTRTKPKKEIEKIYQRATKKEQSKSSGKLEKKSKTKTSEKTSS